MFAIHRKNLFTCLLALALSFISLHSSLALQVTGLYSQDIPVANDGEAERNRAFAEALAAVVVKVSGDPRWLEPHYREGYLSGAELCRSDQLF